MNNFAKNLKELRMDANLTQAMLAEKMGVSQRSVSNWELGARQPDYDTLLKLARLFDVTTDYLLL